MRTRETLTNEREKRRKKENRKRQWRQRREGQEEDTDNAPRHLIPPE